MTLSATASDNVAVAKVEFLVNGALVGSSTASSYSTSWNSASVANGSATITARATDTSGNVTTSAARTVTASNTTTPPPPSSGPANDMFASAQVASGVSGSATGSNVGATKEAGEPNHAGNVGGASVWWTWTAPASGQATVDTAGSSYDTMLGVYTGSSVSALTQVAANDDVSSTVKTSSVTFSAVSGTTYRIAVDGYRGTSTNILSTGSIKLNWTSASTPPPPPAGDTTPPTAALTAPTNGSTVTGSASLAANATDAGGVAKVEFLVDGTVVATDTIAPYSASWDTATHPNGAASLTARATDAAGNVATSAAVAVTVQNAAPSPNDPVVVLAGDQHACEGPNAGATANLVAGLSPAVVAPLGDASGDLGSASEYTTCYDSTWGRYKSISRPAVGNHDYGTAGAGGYFSYFGASAGDPSKGWYSYDVGAWHVVVLNSNCSKIGGCETRSAQLAWLQQDLASHSNACTLAYWHHPLFTSTPEPGTDGWTYYLYKALYDGGADVVVNAHSHTYERFAPQNADGAADPARGVREFVAGTGGTLLTDGTGHAANSQVWENDTAGVLALTLHPSGYDWNFVPVAGGAFAGDTGSAACH